MPIFLNLLIWTFYPYLRANCILRYFAVFRILDKFGRG